ncbi:MAG: hypothetical protein IJ225_11285 [Solobacterium sp.]|nr:hypothetical protein [Solobacterium sp.]
MASKQKLSAKEKEALKQEQERIEFEAEELKKRERLLHLFEDIPAAGMLEESLRSGKPFHAYLLYGPGDSLKDEAALLYGTSLLAGCDHLSAGEESDTLVHETIAQAYAGEHSDFILLNGNRKEAIKKDEVDDIQRRFSRTASSITGRKVYVILHAENSSLSAMNSMLKFLEEPAEEVYAILTADNLERILPTIRSRCITIPFHSLKRETIRSFCREEGLDEEDVYLISSASVKPQEVGRVAAGRSYQTARRMLKQYLNVDERSDLLFVDYEYRYRSKAGNDEGEGIRYKDARDENLDTLSLFFTFLVQYYHDVLKNDGEGPSWYHEAVVAERNRDDFVRTCSQSMKIAAEARDRVNRNNDLSLLLAQTIVQLEDINKCL